MPDFTCGMDGLARYFWISVREKPLNQLWFRLGLALHRVVSPIVMLLIYYGAIVPLGLILQVGGKDLLRLKWEPDAPSYWIPRQPPGPPRGSMSKQF